MIRETKDGLIVEFRIIPNSSKNDIVIEEGYIKVKLTAQPIENKANKALVEFLSKYIKLPKTNIEIIRGETSKDKTLLFKTNDLKKREIIISQLTKS